MLLYRCIAGSHLYGTNLPESDQDFVEVYLEPREAILGLETPQGMPQEIDQTTDTRRFWLGDFLKLCINKGNPNVLEPLWAPDTMIEFVDPDFRSLILGNRSAFTNLAAAKGSHGGYANEQLKRMERPSGEMGAKRKELREKFGWDTKFGAHAVRLLGQGIELMCTDQITLPLREAEREMVLSIRKGEISLERTSKLCSDLIEVLKSSYENRKAEGNVHGNREVANFAVIELRERLWRH